MRYEIREKVRNEIVIVCKPSQGGEKKTIIVGMHDNYRVDNYLVIPVIDSSDNI